MIHPTRRGFAVPMTAFFLLAVPAGAVAQTFGPSWEGHIAVGATSGPTFSGSDDSEIGPAIDVDITWNKRLFLRTETGLGFYAWNAERSGGPLSVGFALGYDFDERIASDDSRLSGLSDVEAGFAFRAFLEYEIGPADLEIVASRGLSGSGHEGTTVEASVGFDVPIWDNTIITASPFVVWADGNYNDAFYGVSASEALASNFEPYSAEAGLQSAGVELGAVHFFTDQIGLFGQVEYSNLLGDAQDSPITFDDQSFEFVAGVLWRF